MVEFLYFVDYLKALNKQYENVERVRVDEYSECISIGIATKKYKEKEEEEDEEEDEEGEERGEEEEDMEDEEEDDKEKENKKETGESYDTKLYSIFLVTSCPEDHVSENEEDTVNIPFCTSNAFYRNWNIAKCHGVNVSYPMQPVLNCDASVLETSKYLQGKNDIEIINWLLENCGKVEGD